MPRVHRIHWQLKFSKTSSLSLLVAALVYHINAAMPIIEHDLLEVVVPAIVQVAQPIAVYRRLTTPKTLPYFETTARLPLIENV